MNYLQLEDLKTQLEVQTRVKDGAENFLIVPNTPVGAVVKLWWAFLLNLDLSLYQGWFAPTSRVRASNGKEEDGQYSWTNQDAWALIFISLPIGVD